MISEGFAIFPKIESIDAMCVVVGIESILRDYGKSKVTLMPNIAHNTVSFMFVRPCSVVQSAIEIVADRK